MLRQAAGRERQRERCGRMSMPVKPVWSQEAASRGTARFYDLRDCASRVDTAGGDSLVSYVMRSRSPLQ
jgi:hypothetical protein